MRSLAGFFIADFASVRSEPRSARLAAIGRGDAGRFRATVIPCARIAPVTAGSFPSSFPGIGEAFGRDHSTVIHAHNLIARRIANDSAFRFSI